MGAFNDDFLLSYAEILQIEESRMIFFFRLSEFFYQLHGRARFRGRCWAAIRLSHRPEPSGRAVRGEVDGLNIGNNMVDGLFFCTTLTVRWRGHTRFVQTGSETSDTGAEVVKPDPGSSWEGHFGGWRRVQMGVSIWGAGQRHSKDEWALSGADVQAPWHGVLEIVWLHCGEALQVGCLRGLEGCPLV